MICLNAAQDACLAHGCLATKPITERQGIRDFQELTFSEWLDAITTFCLFEEEDILRFCFFILDREKNGYIEKDEMRMLVNMLYNIDPVKGPTGNTKVAFEKLSVQQDGKIEFWEFELFNQAFPSLFFPAFRLQVGVSCNQSRKVLQRILFGVRSFLGF